MSDDDQPPLPFGLDDPHTITGRNHPATSHLAAADTLPKTGTTRRMVLDQLAIKPCTDDELFRLTGLGEGTARPRRRELVNLGMVEASEDWRETRTGSLAIVWRITNRGRQALADDKAQR